MAINSFIEIYGQIKSINPDIQITEKKLTFAFFSSSRISSFDLSDLDQSRPDFPAIEQVEDWFIRAFTPAIMPGEYPQYL